MGLQARLADSGLGGVPPPAVGAAWRWQWPLAVTRRALVTPQVSFSFVQRKA